jgi:hypothetical protein
MCTTNWTSTRAIQLTNVQHSASSPRMHATLQYTFRVLVVCQSYQSLPGMKIPCMAQCIGVGCALAIGRVCHNMVWAMFRQNRLSRSSFCPKRSPNPSDHFVPES